VRKKLNKQKYGKAEPTERNKRYFMNITRVSICAFTVLWCFQVGQILAMHRPDSMEFEPVDDEQDQIDGAQMPFFDESEIQQYLFDGSFKHFQNLYEKAAQADRNKLLQILQGLAGGMQQQEKDILLHKVLAANNYEASIILIEFGAQNSQTPPGLLEHVFIKDLMREWYEHALNCDVNIMAQNQEKTRDSIKFCFVNGARVFNIKNSAGRDLIQECLSHRVDKKFWEAQSPSWQTQYRQSRERLIELLNIKTLPPALHQSVLDQGKQHERYADLKISQELVNLGTVAVVVSLLRQALQNLLEKLEAKNQKALQTTEHEGIDAAAWYARLCNQEQDRRKNICQKIDSWWNQLLQRYCFKGAKIQVQERFVQLQQLKNDEWGARCHIAQKLLPCQRLDEDLSIEEEGQPVPNLNIEAVVTSMFRDKFILQDRLLHKHGSEMKGLKKEEKQERFRILLSLFHSHRIARQPYLSSSDSSDGENVDQGFKNEHADKKPLRAGSRDSLDSLKVHRDGDFW
jgi:hypothetical protein